MAGLLLTDVLCASLKICNSLREQRDLQCALANSLIGMDGRKLPDCGNLEESIRFVKGSLVLSERTRCLFAGGSSSSTTSIRFFASDAKRS